MVCFVSLTKFSISQTTYFGPPWARPMKSSSIDPESIEPSPINPEVPDCDNLWCALAQANAVDIEHPKFEALISWLQSGVQRATSVSTAKRSPRTPSPATVRRRERRWFRAYVLPLLVPALPAMTHAPSSTRQRRRRPRTLARPIGSTVGAVGITVPLPTGLLTHTCAEGPMHFGDRAFVRQVKYKMHTYDGRVSHPTSTRRSAPVLKMTSRPRSHNLTACYVNGRLHPEDPRNDLFGGASAGEHPPHTCLVTALRALSLDVPYTVAGPFRALADGNEMVRDLGFRLVASDPSSVTDGKYVLWTPETIGQTGFGHFKAVTVLDGTGTVSDRGLVSKLPLVSLTSSPRCLWYRLEAVLSLEQRGRVERNRQQALERRAQRLRAPYEGSRGPPHALSAEQRERWQANYQRALRIRQSQLLRPQTPVGWVHPAVPETPRDFYSWDCFSLPDVALLRTLNEHARDSRLKFFAETHRYCIDNVPRLGSVTGLVHTFCEQFNASETIASMRSGRNWPRPGYLKSDVPADFLDTLPQCPDSDHLRHLLASSPRDDQAICEAVKAIAASSSDSNAIFDAISLTDSQIVKL